MKKLVSVCGLLTTLLSCPVFASDHHATLFSNVTVFGDSLSDEGNEPIAPATTPNGNLWVRDLANALGLGLTSSATGGSDYACVGATTGPLSGQYLPVSFTDTINIHNAKIPSIQSQLSAYLASRGGKADPHALYTIWGGANDLSQGIQFAVSQTDPHFNIPRFSLGLINASVGNVFSEAARLHAAGGRYIIIPNLPALGDTPLLSQSAFIYANFIYPTVLSGLNQNLAPVIGQDKVPSVIAYLYQHKTASEGDIAAWLEATFNLPSAIAEAIAAKLLPAQSALSSAGSEASVLTEDGMELAALYNNQLLATLNAAGFKLIQIDMAGFLQALQSHYAKFGFVGPYSSYETYSIDANGVPVLNIADGNPNQYIFFDGWHPSAEANLIGAQYIYSVLQGPLYAGILAQAPIAVVDAQNMAVQSALSSIQTGQEILAPHEWKIFASGLQAPGGVSEVSSSPGYDWQNTAFTVGIDYAFNPNALAGIAVGHSMGDVAYAHHAGGFDMDENLVTFFGGYEWQHYYLDGQLNYGNIDYSNVKRHFNLGIFPETLSGSTSGNQLGVATTLGYNFNLLNDNLKMGPLATLDYQKIMIDPYAEASANFEGPNGAFDALQYGKQSNDYLNGGLGWQLSYNTHMSHFDLMPYVEASYNHPFLSNEREVQAGVTTLSGSAFEMPFTTPGEDYGLVNAGIQGIFPHSFSVTLGYNAIVGAPEMNAQTVMLSASLPLA